MRAEKRQFLKIQLEAPQKGKQVIGNQREFNPSEQQQ
jgi:hypothetical protein